MGDPNRRYRPVVNTPSVFPQVPNHHHQVYDVPTVFAEDPNRRYRPVFNTPSVFPQVPNHHHQVYNVPTVFTEDPNRGYRPVVNIVPAFPQVPNHHHQVYDVPTVFAEDPNRRYRPVVNTASVFPQVPNHHHQVYGVPTVLAEDPNHHQPLAPSVSTQNPNQQQHPPFEINVPTVGNSVPSRAMISVVDYCLPDETHNLYDVTFDTHTIHTLLTSSPSHVDSWLSDTFLHNRQNGYNRHRNNLIVGLDVEWRPNTHKNSNYPVATLQLCVGRRCLVFQILHSPYVPQSLVDFLGSACNTFVGVGIEEDVEKLLEDYSLRVANIVDLRGLAVDVLGDREMGNAGLKRLSARVLGVEMEKPKRISRSRWDNAWLTAEQVQYACADAFVSSEVGRTLFGSG